MKNKNQKGFITLIELMIVVAIIGILAAVAVPRFQEMVKKARAGQAAVLESKYSTPLDKQFK